MVMLMFLLFLFIFINLLGKLNMMFYQNLIFLLLFIFFINNNMFFFSLKIMMDMFIDFYSFYLVMLTFWIVGLMFMSLINVNYMNLYIFNIMILLMVLFYTFISIDFYLIYFFFKIKMIPTLFLIIGWGFQYERIEAGIYMFISAYFAPLPMQYFLLKIYGSLEFLDMIMMMNMNLINNIYYYMYLLLAFLIKLPMFMFHLWLPKAHVEAPISGSMILAGIMLKLGSYGMLRVMLIMEELCFNYNYLIMSFSLVGSLYISFVCLKQIDMKMLIAYSSVVHMGFLVVSLMTLNIWSYMGSLIMMISHGLCFPGLFCLVNMNYERLKSRSMYWNKGMMNIIPSTSLFWFFLSVFNMASPPSLNLFSEIIMMNSVMMWSNAFLLNLMIMMFMSVLYMMLFYSSIQHGKLCKNLNNFFNINKREYLLVILHLIPLFYLILIM
uniref:NADH-ubiquinone oxidoreductase chain 4 n=1 Tax=Synergus sp. 1 DYB-20230501 TaxID=3136278 RepID=A0AAU6QCF0_9HYME